MNQSFHGGRLAEAAREFGLEIKDLSDFSSNINPFCPAISSEQWQTWKNEIYRYPELDAEPLQRQIAQVYGLDPKQVLPTSGGIEALYLAVRLFPGKRLGVIEPTFSDYARAIEAAGEKPGRAVLPMEMWSLPISSWAELLKPFEVVILGNPNNPTGRLQSAADLLSLWKQPWAAAQAWIIDEAFIEFAPDAEKETILRELPENVIVLRSLTKSWGIPGLRLGFLASSNLNWMERLALMQPPWAINSIAQSWARSFLNPHYHRELSAGLDRLHRIKLRFYSDLARIVGIEVIPSAANFILIHLKDSALNSSSLYQQLGQIGLIIRRCDSFYGLEKGRFIRIAVKSEPENDLFAAIFSKICAWEIRRAH